MHPRTKASLLWGLIGMLSFLVLVQGYRLFTSDALAIPVVLGMTILVGVVSTVGSYLLAGHRLVKRQA